ncbi:MAG: hypothetical protein MJ249_01755 [Kiritimatiellae bacterium]|nr:hypothetical protein [Kiritimatiellia bacterium]
MVENLQSFYVNTVYACAVGVGVCTIGAGAYWIAKKLARSTRQIAAVSLVGAVLIGGMVVVGTDGAGTKPGTNDVSQVEGGTNVLNGVVQGRARIPAAPQCGVNMENNGQALRRSRSLRPTGMADVTQGWRLVSVSSNALPAATFTMPTNAIVWESAQRCGRGWGSWKIPVGGWHFPFGEEGWTNAFVWAEGYFRSRFNSRANEISILSERMALCPAANWSRYNLPSSRAWCQTNGVGGLVTTFENAAVGDDPAKIVSAQLELLPQSGRVALRYDLHAVGDTQYEVGVTANGTNHFVTVGSNTSEVVFQRVHPDDWDFDGLPNALDPNPYQPEANAGFNQSDAWAMLAFPSNAAEIAAMGYPAWAAARAADPNRRLVSFTLASKNNTWPVCLAFGDVQVMCDGTERIVFPIDCGARYTFSVSGGELAAVSMPDVETREGLWQDWYNPWDFSVGDVTVHLESAGTGWVSRIPDVLMGDLSPVYLPPGTSHAFSAVITNCHADAFLGCSWSGDSGLSFTETNVLETTVSNPVGQWTGEMSDVSFVASFVGGFEITNVLNVITGAQTDPIEHETVEEGNVRLTLSMPRGLVCQGGRQLMTMSFDSSVATNGHVVLQCLRGHDRISLYAAVSNDMPVAVSNRWPVTRTHRFECAIQGNSNSDYEGVEFSYTFVPAEGTNVVVTGRSTVFTCYTQPVTTVGVESQAGDANRLIVNPSFFSRETNAVFRVEVIPESIPDSKILWRPVAGRATFDGVRTGREVRLVDGDGMVDLEISVLGAFDERMHLKSRFVGD